MCVSERERQRNTTNWHAYDFCAMGRLQLVGSLKRKDSFANDPYERDYISKKRPILLRSLLIVATPYGVCEKKYSNGCVCEREGGHSKVYVWV